MITLRVNGVERRLPNDKFFVPGSVLSMDVDPANPLAYGGHAYWTLGQFVEKQGYTAAH